jgi:antirestriction protein ArdC
MSSINYAVVASAMAEKGFEGEPYTDVKTFKGWLEAGRCVKKGEKAFCSVSVYLQVEQKTEGKDDKKSERKYRSIPKTSHLFHVSQTTELEAKQ